TIASVVMPTRFVLVPSISTSIVPADGRTMPMTHFMSVDLPLPLVPSSATVSPSRTSRVTPCKTLTAPYPASRPAMVSLAAKIGRHDVVLTHHIARVAIGDLTSRHQHHEPLGERQNRAHDVLDQNDGDALFLIQAD